MSLIKCKECGKELPENSKFCLNCGAKIELFSEEEMEQTETETETKQETKETKVSKNTFEKSNINNKKLSKFDKITIIVIVMAVVFLVAYPIFNYLDKTVFEEMRLYNQAISYIENKDYGDAVFILKDLDYKDSKELLIENETLFKDQQYKQALSYIKENTQESLIKAESILNGLDSGYKDVASLLADCALTIGNNYYAAGDFDNALSYYNKLDATQKEELQKNIDAINIYKELQGEWTGTASTEGILIDKNKFTIFLFGNVTSAGKFIVTQKISGELNIDDLINHNDIRVSFSENYQDMFLSLKNNKLVILIDNDPSKRPYNYSKKNFSDNCASKPAIGMTKEEVINSTWGKPEEINKDTYEWGVNEQWCYPNYKYIFIEDGVVTSISE